MRVNLWKLLQFFFSYEYTQYRADGVDGTQEMERN